MNLTGEKAARYSGRAEVQSGGKKVSRGYPPNNGSFNGPNESAKPRKAVYQIWKDDGRQPIKMASKTIAYMEKIS